MVGMPPSDTKKCLRFLSDSKVIAWNQDGRKSYSLWASSFNPYKLDQILGRKVKETSITHRDLLNLTQDHLGATQVSIPWGHSQDWQAMEYVLTAEHFNAKTLKDLAHYFSHDAKLGLQEGTRSCVIWLVAQNQDDISLFKQSAQKTLDEAFPESDPLPIVLLLPIHEEPMLIESMRNKKTLENFTQTDKDDCGQDVFRARLAQEETNIQQALINIRGGENYSDTPRFHTQFIVPKAYKARIQQLANTSLVRLLEALYAMAYRFAPPEFFPQYAISARNFRNVVKTVSIDVLHSDANSLGGTIRSNSSANDLVKLLIQKWTIIATDNRVKSPSQEHIASAWEGLDSFFPAGDGENLVRTTVLAFLNPPYGYDYNTFALIFCAWFGFNSHNLQILANGAPINIKQLDEWLQAGPKEFIQSLLSEKVALARRDLNKTTKEIKALLAKVKNGGLSQKEANDCLAKFKDFVETDSANADLVEEARKEIKNVQHSIEVVNDYEKQAKEILGAVNRERNIKKLVSFLDGLLEGADNTLVLASAPSPSEIRAKIQQWLKQVVDDQCAEYENIEDIADLSLNRRELESLRQDLTRLKLPALAERVKQSSDTLQKNGELLQIRQKEAGIQSELRMLPPNAPLKFLYDFREKWANYDGLSKETQKIRDAQIRSVEKEIQQIEEAIDTIEKGVEQVDSKQALDELRRSLMLLVHRLEGTALVKRLDKPRSIMELLTSFFEELWKVENTTVTTEEDVQKLQEKLKDISKKYSKTLSDKQKRSVEKSETALEKRIRDYEQQAMQMIEEFEKVFEKGSRIAELRAKLDRPIPFLSEKAEKRLSTLIQKIDKKLDSDVILQIEISFKKIKDKKVRQECIKRLIDIEKE